MRSLIIIPIILNLIFLCSLAVANDSKIIGPSYEEIENEVVSVSNKFPDLAKRVVYGLSKQGRNLNLLRISKKSATETETAKGKRKAVYISGSTHGYEYLNIEDRLPR